MCGICGELRKGERSGPPDVAAVGRMMEEMVPRGPDGGGVYSHGKAVLPTREDPEGFAGDDIRGTLIPES